MSGEFSAALLAGGPSSRMGRDKAYLETEGGVLWRVQLQKLRSLGPEELMISANRDQQFETDAGRIVRDEREDHGPMGGLLSCLRRCSSDRLLLLGIDMPRMAEGFLRGLVDHGSGVVCQLDGRFEPLAAVYPAGLEAEIEERLDAGDLAMQGLVRALVERGAMQVREIADGERGLFENWNLPQDVRHV